MLILISVFCDEKTSEYTHRSTDMPKVTDKIYHVMLY